MEIKTSAISSTNLDTVKKTNEIERDEKFRFALIGKIDKLDLKEKLQTMIEEITDQGNKIAKHKDIRDMKKYREKIKEFINEVVTNSHEFSRDNFLDRRGRHRVHGIIRLVDKNLDELAQELIKEEKKNIDVLSKVGEIRGLLLDLII